MNKPTLLIKIAKNRVFFNPRLSIALEQSNIPVKDLMFNPGREFYWLVEMEDFYPQTGRLQIKVLDYKETFAAKFDTQEPPKEVKELFFSEQLDWNYLEPQLSFYSKGKLRGQIKNIPESSLPEKTGKVSADFTPIPQERVISTTFDIAFSDIKINLGHVSFQKHIPQLNQEVEFKIPNDFLLPEFDHIKFWFAKKLGRKLRVQAEILTLDWAITQVNAKSQAIDAISSEMVDSIKRQRTLGILKKPKITQPDKTLFTSEDIFDQFDPEDKLLGNVFHESDKSLLEHILANSKIRNRQQIIYLSGTIQSEKEKIRFTLRPLFGFLFFVQGERQSHFIWELLNSHATYIWSIEKGGQSIGAQYRYVEEAINTIRDTGRDAYKSAYRQNALGHEWYAFNVLSHKHAESSLKDGFPIWKHRLNELLV
ncbi:MAG: hypothetical protein R3D58_13715 [Saprospiraceae bacterium]